MGKKSIARIQVEGIIQKKNETYSQKWLLETIKKVQEDKRNVAIMLYVNTPGGGVYESDEVYVALQKYKEKTKRPVYAYFASLAASGGYYIGCAADRIIANRNTLTGSIGVIAGQFVDVSGLMAKCGVKSEIIHAGRNKTMGSIIESVTEEQRSIMQSIADECYEQFVGIVAESRKLDAARVTELADGRIYTARQAAAAGLVDDVATFDEAVVLLKEREFHDKEYKAEVKKFAYKAKKSLMSAIKGASGYFGSPSALVEKVLKPGIPFPAYYYGGSGR